MTENAPQRAPAGLAARGRRFWRETVARFELTDAELQILQEACRTLDRLDSLDALVTEQGATIEGSTGQTILHPAIGEARQQRVTFERLVKALALPDEDEHAGPEAMTDPSAKARHAARTRWAKHG